MTRIIGGIEVEPGWQSKPKHPIREVLRWLCDRSPPKYVQGYDLKGLKDDEMDHLQQWAVTSIDKTPLFWATGIGMLDAAEAIVREAVSNGNIPAEDSDWRTKGVHPKWYEPRKKRMRKKTKP